jgi:trehalose/maltose hydrolase-like predicted phosphorylase
MSRPHLIDADWRIAERDLTLTPAALESVFAVGNGYLGVRGTAEDGTAAHDPGVVLNGFHETWPIVYPEDAYGLARTGQTIVAPPDASMVRLAVEGGARVLRSERTLDMRRGVLLREAELAVSGGRLRLRSRRLASLADRHVVALRLELTMLEGATDLELGSELVLREPDRGGDDDPRRGKGFAERVLDPVSSWAAGTRALLEHETRHSGLRLASGTAHRYGGVPVEISSTALPDGAETRVRAKLEAGQTDAQARVDGNGRDALRRRRRGNRARASASGGQTRKLVRRFCPLLRHLRRRLRGVAALRAQHRKPAAHPRRWRGIGLRTGHPRHHAENARFARPPQLLATVPGNLRDRWRAR